MAAATAVGGAAVDANRTHLFNPAWPPHARFHDAQTISLAALLGGGLYALHRRDDAAAGAALPALFWASMASAFLYPGTGGLQAEFPELIPRIRGVWIDERFAAGTMLGLGAVGYVLTRRR
ncbi:hypothetical protein B841_09645 [Corynebacterium maris DSM 45190]|uniref:Uncharacterized protein n=1 Tax=Corynebacterium maris DSM 45190 TaxID=1224163 RepID=S5TKI9_9CORY|nr:DUF6640 family protein [Corynebacterium maris]AGS35401.1 hypothetical protein B841_09645 [Corynebacterium maris DSM 45190]